MHACERATRKDAVSLVPNTRIANSLNLIDFLPVRVWHWIYSAEKWWQWHVKISSLVAVLIFEAKRTAPKNSNSPFAVRCVVWRSVVSTSRRGDGFFLQACSMSYLHASNAYFARLISYAASFWTLSTFTIDKRFMFSSCVRPFSNCVNWFQHGGNCARNRLFVCISHQQKISRLLVFQAHCCHSPFLSASSRLYKKKTAIARRKMKTNAVNSSCAFHPVAYFIALLEWPKEVHRAKSSISQTWHRNK